MMMAAYAVLVVEDNPVNQRVTLAVLAQIGIQADLAEDGLQAITRFKQRAYDLVIMDCQMPRLDGWEATRAIRRLEQDTGRRCPIIALTAQAMAGDRERCLSSGMDDYLTKPVNVQLLQRTVLRHVENGPAPSPAAPPVSTVPAPQRQACILDPEIVQTIRGFGPSGVQEVFGIMLTDLPERRARLRQAIAQVDARTLAAVAHGVKGACGTVGAAALGQAAAQLERLGRAEDIPGATALWPVVDELFAGTIREIQDLVAAAGGG